MLERIRQALGHPSRPSRPPSEAAIGLSTPADSRLEGVLPRIPPEELVPKFEEELRKVSGVCHRVSTPAELEEVVRTVLSAAGTASVVLSRNPLLRELGLAERLGRLGLPVDVFPSPGPESSASQTQDALQGSEPAVALTESQAAEHAFREQCFSAAVGITGVDFVLAESGSLVLTSATEGSQLVSLAPPVHIVLYRRRQVVPFLEDVLDGLVPAHNADVASAGRSVVFVTGPSRTADIEQILIRGVHGPREVHAVLVEDSCLT